jgi:NAD(P)-dependent dehydrogenase (short-subunit alcohol dehydrogenase family)
MLSPKGFAAVIQNNLIGTWNMTSVVATQVFIPQKKGKIINIIAQIVRGFPGMVHTGSARAGVDNLTKTLAIEWAPYGINVNAVAPGIILSSGTERYDVGILKNAIKAIPKGRAGKVEEVAALVAFLCTPIADFITGQTYYIDGGQSLFGDIIDPRKWAKSKL